MIRPGIRRAFRLALWRRESVRERVEEEIALHMALRAEQLERRGVPPDEARAEARRRFGGGTDEDRLRRALVRTAQHRETSMRGGEWVAALGQDLRYAARGLLREPAFTALVIVTLALGIGANASMFGLLDRLLLRGPAHVVDSDRVRRLYLTTEPPGMGEFTGPTVGYVTYTDLRDGVPALSRVAAYTGAGEVTMGQGAEAQRVRERSVTWSYFPLLGVRPHLGRFFTEAEDSPPRGETVAVVSHAAWQRLFGGDPRILGREVMLTGRTYTIIGVTPPGFTGHALEVTDFWLPVTARRPQPTDDWATTRFAQWLEILGRLAPDATAEQANAQATAAHRAAYDGPESYEREARLTMRPLHFDDSGKEAMEVTVSRWLVGVSAVVLLIACINVANLLFARALRRRREIAVRLALGIGRSRLFRLLLVEGLLLAVLGGAAGLLVAAWGGGIIRGTLLPDVAWSGSVVDGGVLLFATAATLVTGVAITLLPAFRASRPNLTSALKEGTRQAGTTRGGIRMGLTVAQAALSMMLLVGAGLFVRSLYNVRALDLGIEPERVLTIQPTWIGLTALTPEEFQSVQRQRDRTRVDALERLRGHPDVESAALTIGLPFSSRFSVRLRVAGWDSIPRLPGGGPYVQAVTSGYFETLGTPILSGRAFTDEDRAGSEPVAIVSETMARTLWPGGDPLGQCLYIGRDDPPCSRIVGVAADTRRGQIRAEDPAMQYYVPFGQEQGIGGTIVLVRPRGEAAAAIEAMRGVIREVDPSVGYVIVSTLQERIDPQMQPWRLGATMFGVFGVLALLVAAVGLYSVMSYTAAQRMHEMGVRIALGAASWDIRRLILGAGFWTAAAGVAIGTGLALVGGRYIESLLFETSARDGAVLAVVAVTLLGVALVASAVPAWRATRVDPVTALRAD